MLDNPAVQAAFIPFALGLTLGFLLWGTRFLAVAVLAGVLAVVGLTIGLSLEPLTSVKKLVLSVTAITVLGMAAGTTGGSLRRSTDLALAAIAGGCAVWVVLRVLQQMDAWRPWLTGAAALAFVFVTVASSMAAGATSPLRGAVVGACLGWGSGVLALLGASALLAQIGLAAGTASAAVALVQMIRGEARAGRTVVIPACVTASLVGVLASATGELRWYCLVPLPFAPLAARWMPWGAERPAWQRAVLTGVVTAAPVAVAVALAWWSATGQGAG